MTAATLILALRRFFGRRGIPSVMLSDNALTFKRVDKIFKKMQRDPVINDWLASNRIKWRFSSSLAPWWGGFWERMIRTTKDFLYKIVLRSKLFYDRLHTVLVEIESAINSRPFVYQAEEDSDLVALTPSLLLCGRRSTSFPLSFPPFDFSHHLDAISLLQLDGKRRQLLAGWWRRWQSEYLRDLMQFHCSGKDGLPIEIGEVVLVHKALIERVKWNFARVVELLRGRGGLIRAAKLRMPDGSRIVRAIQCLYPLEVRASALDTINSDDLPRIERAPTEDPDTVINASPVSPPTTVPDLPDVTEDPTRLLPTPSPLTPHPTDPPPVTSTPDESDQDIVVAASEVPVPARRPRGRPKGSRLHRDRSPDNVVEYKGRRKPNLRYQEDRQRSLPDARFSSSLTEFVLEARLISSVLQQPAC